MRFKYSKTQEGIGQAESHILNKMIQLGKLIIRANDLEEERGCSRAIANLILSRLCKKGWIQRLQAGIYRVVPMGSPSINPIPEDAWAIAAELFSPCYISGWTAAEHWELTEQIFNSTVIFTVRKQRKKDFMIAGLNYRTKSIAEEDIFGVKKIWSSNTQILIADIHRTVIDVLDDPEIGGGGRQTLDIVKEYFQNPEANPKILYQYAKKLGRRAVFKRLGFIAERLKCFPQYLLDDLHSEIKTGIIKFDPHGANSGTIVTKWGIKVNIPLGDIL